MERMIINGDFWDCQLYDNRLYVWYIDGDVCVYDYRRILGSAEYSEADRLSRINGNLLEKCLVHRFYMPQRFLPIDTEIVNSSLYVATDNGVYRQSLLARHEFQKIWDCKLTSISANSNKLLALTAGKDGLFVLRRSNDEEFMKWKKVENGIFQISNDMAISASFCDGGIYATSIYAPSYYVPMQNHFHDNELKTDRSIMRDDAFECSLSGAWKNELYFVNGQTLRIYRINTSGRKPTFKYVQAIEFQQWKGNLLSVIRTSWGYVFELDNAVVILDEAGDVISLPGGAVNIRSFQRSKIHSNVLHVVMDDRLEILTSHNNDHL